jgi:hypothetical protein
MNVPSKIVEAIALINRTSPDILLGCNFNNFRKPKKQEWVYYFDHEDVACVGSVMDIEDSGIVCVHTENGANYRFSTKNKNFDYRSTKTINGSYFLLYSIAESMTAIDRFNFNQKENAKINCFNLLIDEIKNLCAKEDHDLIQEIRRLIAYRKSIDAGSEQALDDTKLFTEEEQK